MVVAKRQGREKPTKIEQRKVKERSEGWGSLVGCRLWGCTESDTTEVT